MNTIPYKTYLDENELPECWYNVRADMEKKPAPLLNPATGAPCTAEDLSHVFCEELVAQELDETTPLLYDQKLMEAVSVKQTDVFAAAQQFARVEGILPAPESSHAIRAAIDAALKCKAEGREETILFGLTGTGYFDMKAYEAFNDGTMSDYEPTDEDLKRSFAKFPKVAGL
ncbi:MAG: hypothetical protein IKJ89_10615 [Kiritimatiellae bacterium]|nr:hypothetical protein [Kiritimatiellia bacterium]